MKVNKTKKLMESTSGFTMMEMIITVALVAIFFSCVVTILPMVTKAYNKMIHLNYARQIATSIMETAEEQLTYSTGVTVEEGKINYTYAGESREIILGKNGIIPGLVYDTEGYYMKNNVTLSATIDQIQRLCTLTISVSDKNDNFVMIKERTFKLIGIEYSG